MYPAIAIAGGSNSKLLAEFAQGRSLVEASAAEFLITQTESGLQLSWFQEPGNKPLLFCIEVEKFVARLHSFPSAKQAGLNQALGRKTTSVIDATAGWGGDALLMCAQGYQLTLIERNPLMALMLRDAMQRLADTEWAHHHHILPVEVREGDAIELLASGQLPADCVYLDPMFPPKRKRSAVANKNMQLLQRLVGTDADCSDLVGAAITGGYRRVAVKRPHHAAPLHPAPSMQFTSKLVNYDVYLSGH